MLGLIMGDITLREALDEYKNVYMAYRNFAERTREEYQNDLEGFIEFIEKSGVTRAEELGLPIIERFVANLEQKGFASLTRKRKVVSTRSFLLFLYQDGYIDTNIANKVILPFTESIMPNILTQTECDQLRSACSDSPRDAAIIELLLQAGIKLSELTRLTLNDVELVDERQAGEKTDGHVRILGGRGKKDRIIPLNSTACASMCNYLNVRENAGNNTLFLNRFGGPLRDRGVQKILKKHLKKAGIGGASINTLRHTFAVQHIAEGANLKATQKVMGLKDARSTSPYASLANGVGN